MSRSSCAHSECSVWRVRRKWAAGMASGSFVNVCLAEGAADSGAAQTQRRHHPGCFAQAFLLGSAEQVTRWLRAAALVAWSDAADIRMLTVSGLKCHNWRRHDSPQAW
jgi:hypothetical protein